MVEGRGWCHRASVVGEGDDWCHSLAEGSGWDRCREEAVSSGHFRAPAAD